MGPTRPLLAPRLRFDFNFARLRPEDLTPILGTAVTGDLRAESLAVWCGFRGFSVRRRPIVAARSGGEVVILSTASLGASSLPLL